MARKRSRLGRPVRERPLYMDAVDEFHRRMASGAWPNGMVMPPMRELARQLGLGLTTVRLAVEVLKSEERLVATPRRRLVIQTKGGAEPSAQRTILEVVPNLLDLLQRSAYFRQMQLGIESGASRTGSPLMICHDDHFRDAIPQAFLHFALRGIVVCGTIKPALIAQYAKLNVPVALADQDGAGHRVHSVCVDNEGSGYEAARQLLSAGHRHVALLRHVLSSYRDVDPDSRARQSGFELALREAGRALPRDAVFNTVQGQSSPSVVRLLETRPRYTGIFVTSEGAAKTVVRLARERGLSVPRELSVVGVGGLQPDVTDVSAARADFYQIGKRATMLLAEPRDPPQHLKEPVRWVDGKTLARCPAT